MPQTLQVLGSYGMELDIEFAEIVRDFGDGYDDNVLVGNSSGEKFYRLVLEFLPDGTDQLSVVDPEDSLTKSYADYIWDFFVRRKQDGEAFNITDPRDGATVLVKFAESRLSYQFLTYKLFGSGLLLRQHRA